jgi:uncharacterized membrane protein YdjX (TVP38/TMEM64 family)
VLRKLLSAPAPRRFALFIAFVAATFCIAAVGARRNLPLTPETVRDLIRSWGLLGPVIFMGAFILRPFFFFPSTLLFLAGGLAFGILWGTIYAAIGCTLGSMIGFSIARALGYEFVQQQLGERFARLHGTPWGVGLVFLLNLIPVVPMTAINYGAGLSGMEILPFTAAVIAGLTPRAFAYTVFGHSLLDLGSNEFFVALALLAVLLVIPLYVRRRLNARGATLSLLG